MQTVSAHSWKPLDLLLYRQAGSLHRALLVMLQQVLLPLMRQSTPAPSPGTGLLPAQRYKVLQQQAALAKAGCRK
jgi:hypothetical protein